MKINLKQALKLRQTLRLNLRQGLKEGKANSTVTRIFTPLLGSGVQHYTHNTITMSADFEIEIDYKLYNLTTDNALIGDTDALSGDIWKINKDNNSMLIRIGGTTYTTTGSYTEDLKLNTAKMTRVGTTVKVFRNDVEIYSATIALVDFTINMVGTRQNGAYDSFSGILANYKVTNIASLVMDAPLDKQYTAAAPTVINNADANNPLTAVNLDNAGSAFTSSDTYGWLGENNVGAPTRISDDWTNNGDGSYTIDTPDGNFSDCELQFGVSEVGFTYFVEVTVNEPVGNSSLRLRNCDPNIDFRTAGDYSGSVVAASSACPVINRRGGARPFIQTISNISNRQVLEVAS